MGIIGASASDRLHNLQAATYDDSTKNTKSTNETIEENFVPFVPFVDKNLSFSSWIDLLLKTGDMWLIGTML
ncbi:MAG: hypothetical protein EBU88_01865 [Acidobacteria bacterium]|nr:hypothetical protein [Acidobacteriota bacterium]